MLYFLCKNHGYDDRKKRPLLLVLNQLKHDAPLGTKVTHDSSSLLPPHLDCILLAVYWCLYEDVKDWSCHIRSSHIIIIYKESKNDMDRTFVSFLYLFLYCISDHGIFKRQKFQHTLKWYNIPPDIVDANDRCYLYSYEHLSNLVILQ